MALANNPDVTFDEIITTVYPQMKDDVIFSTVGLQLYKIQLCEIAIEKEKQGERGDPITIFPALHHVVTTGNDAKPPWLYWRRIVPIGYTRMLY